MKTRRPLLQLSILIAVSLLLAQSIVAKSCLWKISSDDHTLFLQGSIHLLKSDNYPLAPAIEAAFSNSSVIVLEVDMKEMQSTQSQQRMLQKALLLPPNSLDKELSKPVYTAFKNKCEEVGLMPAMINQSKPWFAATLLTITKVTKMGFNTEQGLETYFNNKAKAANKKTTGLETAAFQIDLLDSLAQLNADDFINRTLKDLEIIEQDMDTLVKAWTEGDVDTLGKLINKSFDEYPEMHKTFVADRNIQWVKAFKTYLTQPETHMVIVGAGHLPGEKGLLELLKQAGYKIEQL